MGIIHLKIEGMSCSGCVKSVKEALSGVNGVESVSVDLQTAQAEIIPASERLDISQLITAVKLAGFQAMPGK